MNINRYKCESYCLCGSRKGHFERRDDGEWVQWSAIEPFITKAAEELLIVEREIGVPSEALKLLEPTPSRTNIQHLEKNDGS